jgi:hypothetical protein
MAAALAEWPFYAFALAVFLAGLALFGLWAFFRGGTEGLREAVPVVGPLVAAASVSGLFTGLTFLSIREAGGVGLRVTGAMKDVLKSRFLARLHQTVRYIAFPLAAMGGFLLARLPVPATRRPARNLFLSLMVAWVAMTVLAGAAQLAGIPVAGGRLLSYLFAIPILTGVMVWLLARSAFERMGRVGVAIGVAVVVLAVGVFGAVAYKGGRGLKPWMEPDAVQQIATTGVYIDRFAPGRDVVFVIATPKRRDNDTLGRWWYVIRAILPPHQVPRAHRFIGSPRDYEAAIRSGSSALPTDIRAVRGRPPLAVVIQRYNPSGFEEVASASPGQLVAEGVLTLDGPIPSQPVSAVRAPEARTSAFGLIWVGAVIVLILFVVGTGWAVALLPADPVVVMGLAPVLGAAVLAMVALLWDLVRFRFGPAGALGPLFVSVVGGLVAAGLRARRDARTGGPPALGPATLAVSED